MFKRWWINLKNLHRQIIKVDMRKLYYIAIILCFASCKQSQKELNTTKDFNVGLEELVLNSNKIGVEYFVKVNNSKDILEYKITYIGRIENSKKEKLDFIYSTIFSGLYEDSKRANSTITIYRNQKRFGYYYVGSGFNKTPVISKNEVRVSYDDNCNQETLINFRDSIPNKIFIECKKENGEMLGDLYNFEKYK